MKVLRPGIRKTVERDVSVLLGMARALSTIPAVRASDLAGHMEHFVDGIHRQTDLNLEVEHYAKFRENFAEVDEIVFPEVYPDLSTSRVLTMEFIRGRKIQEVEPGAYPGLAPILHHSFLKMAFEDGFIHADLHPGNFLILDEGRVAIFDVGLVKELGEDLLVQFIDWNKCLIFGQTDDFREHLETYFFDDVQEVDWDELLPHLERFVAKFRGQSFQDLEAGDLLNDAFALGRKYGLKPVAEFTLIMVAVVTAEGVAKQIDPETDSLAKIGEFLMPLMAKRGMIRTGRSTDDPKPPPETSDA